MRLKHASSGWCIPSEVGADLQGIDATGEGLCLIQFAVLLLAELIPAIAVTCTSMADILQEQQQHLEQAAAAAAEASGFQNRFVEFLSCFIFLVYPFVMEHGKVLYGHTNSPAALPLARLLLLLLRGVSAHPSLSAAAATPQPYSNSSNNMAGNSSSSMAGNSSSMAGNSSSSITGQQVPCPQSTPAACALAAASFAELNRGGNFAHLCIYFCHDLTFSLFSHYNQGAPSSPPAALRKSLTSPDLRDLLLVNLASAARLLHSERGGKCPVKMLLPCGRSSEAQGSSSSRSRQKQQALLVPAYHEQLLAMMGGGWGKGSVLVTEPVEADAQAFGGYRVAAPAAGKGAVAKVMQRWEKLSEQEGAQGTSWAELARGALDNQWEVLQRMLQHGPEMGKVYDRQTTLAVVLVLLELQLLDFNSQEQNQRQMLMYFMYCHWTVLSQLKGGEGQKGTGAGSSIAAAAVAGAGASNNGGGGEPVTAGLLEPLLHLQSTVMLDVLTLTGYGCNSSTTTSSSSSSSRTLRNDIVSSANSSRDDCSRSGKDRQGDLSRAESTPTPTTTSNISSSSRKSGGNSRSQAVGGTKTKNTSSSSRAKGPAGKCGNSASGTLRDRQAGLRELDGAEEGKAYLEDTVFVWSQMLCMAMNAGEEGQRIRAVVPLGIGLQPWSREAAGCVGCVLLCSRRRLCGGVTDLTLKCLLAERAPVQPFLGMALWHPIALFNMSIGFEQTVTQAADVRTWWLPLAPGVCTL